jgi:hypothetical protein
MEGLNKIFCGSDVKNTGICECFFDPKLITGAILVPKNKVFTSDELLDANIAATLAAAVSAAQASRIYPFQPFETITDNTEDPTRQTFGYGTVKTVREGKYNWALQFINGGLNLSNALRTFNGLIGKYAIIWLESQNTMIGTSKKDANDEWGLAGVPLSDLYQRPWRPSDGSNVSNYTFEASFDPVYINEKIAFKKVSFDSYLLAELAGLEDVKLTLVAAAEGGTTIEVSAETDCGSTNFYDLFKTELAQSAAWRVKDSAGDPVTVSGVVANDGPKTWTLTVSGHTNEDGDTIQLEEPAVLGANPINVVGYESDVLTLDFGS